MPAAPRAVQIFELSENIRGNDWADLIRFRLAWSTSGLYYKVITSSQFS
jgi:hypothetical protein